MEKIRFLECLSKQYPTIDSAATEIINLQSILNLPKGTEHFLSDIHGEYKAFAHVLRNGSGAVMKKIDDVFGDTLFEDQKEDLASLIYYPSEKLQYVKNQGRADSSWYRTTLYRLVSVCQIVSSKYTRSKVRKAMPENFRYVIEELITEKKEVLNKKAYYDEIINTIIEIGCADEFIVEMSNLIQRLVIDHLHIIGDIYDRGYGSHFVMDSLLNYHSLDIQWGNHDVLWMGAFAGQTACIANIVRIDQAAVSVQDANDLHVIAHAGIQCFCYAADGGVQTRTVAAGSQDSNTFFHSKALFHLVFSAARSAFQSQSARRSTCL